MPRIGFFRNPSADFRINLKASFADRKHTTGYAQLTVPVNEAKTPPRILRRKIKTKILRIYHLVMVWLASHPRFQNFLTLIY